MFVALTFWHLLIVPETVPEMVLNNKQKLTLCLLPVIVDARGLSTNESTVCTSVNHTRGPERKKLSHFCQLTSRVLFGLFAVFIDGHHQENLFVMVNHAMHINY